MRKASSEHAVDLAMQHENIVFIGSDLGAGAMSRFQAQMPDRFFMEGISEQHLIGFAAGLAMEGFVPIVNTIATFLTRRALEQITLDICLDRLPVILMGNGAGLVYAPLGPSHLAIDDIALLRPLPGMTILSPCDPTEMRLLMDEAVKCNGPVYIRVGPSGIPSIRQRSDRVQIGRPDVLKPPGAIVLVSTGQLTQAALQAAALLEQHGWSVGVVHVHTIKPLLLDDIRVPLLNVSLLVTIEEHSRTGGLGAALLEALSSETAPMPPLLRLGLPDAFPEGYGSQEYLLSKYGLTAQGIATAVQRSCIGS